MKIHRSPTPQRSRRYGTATDPRTFAARYAPKSSGTASFLRPLSAAIFTWIGRYDLLVGQDGASGETKAQATRQDALTSAAYGVVEYCTAILERKTANRSCDVRAAAEVMCGRGFSIFSDRWPSGNQKPVASRN